ncbi:metallophosphoesterase [Pseudodesulfovibrio tunisiensis]|uniref:metallophosphoesterase n=1 Tax=Pseudodesulfovibrio tunisiensis TaxID=463192 RepID=UPI001FB4EE1D|nr:metallophosphoesterase [Pseudodesulfovibrio tunisiensis]
MAEGKTIFISDIHMGTQNSLYPESGSPWCWLREDRARMLGDFLADVARRDDVGSVVILGDLFDDWVVPASMEPEPDMFQSIARASQNRPVMDGFSAILEAGKELVYVHGNHDMFLSEDMLQQLIPGIVFVPDRDGQGPGTAVYRDGVIAAEHGCAYCLVNSPFRNEQGEFVHPAGYYISRLAAYGEFEGDGVNYLEALALALRRGLNSDRIVGTMVRAAADGVDYATDREIVLNAGIAHTVADVADAFAGWFDVWPGDKDVRVDAGQALDGEIGRLRDSAAAEYFGPGTASVVIFGHTHTARLWARPFDLTYKGDATRPQEYIYANTGTWVNGKAATYVETEEVDGRMHVRLFRQLRGRGNLLGEFHVPA